MTKDIADIILNILKNDINDFMKYAVGINEWMKENGY